MQYYKTKTKRKLKEKKYKNEIKQTSKILIYTERKFKKKSIQ